MIFKKRFDIVTFGSAVIDVFINTEIKEKNKKISYPVGEKILIGDLKFDWGGGGTNTAVAFSRLGLKTGFIGKLGKDGNGEKILKLLKKEKIDFLGRQGEGKTGYSVILDSKEHNRTILTYKGSNNDLRLNEIQIPKTKWLYYSSLLENSLKTQIKLAKKLRGKTKLVFNPSSYLIKKNLRNIKEILKLTEILILNKEEAQLLVGKKSGKSLLKKLYKLGPEIVTVTNKDKEVISFNGEKMYKEKPGKVKARERTGAGDAFSSGFVAGIIKNKSIKDSLKLGIKEAESVIRYFGAKNNLIRK